MEDFDIDLAYSLPGLDGSGEMYFITNSLTIALRIIPLEVNQSENCCCRRFLKK
jgi:hypothetical protein